MKRMMMLGAAGLAACLYLDTGVAMAADAAERYRWALRVMVTG